MARDLNSSETSRVLVLLEAWFSLPGFARRCASSSGTEVARWNFVNAWPMRYKAPDFDATAGRMFFRGLLVRLFAIGGVTGLFLATLGYLLLIRRRHLAVLMSVSTIVVAANAQLLRRLRLRPEMVAS